MSLKVQFYTVLFKAKECINKKWESFPRPVKWFLAMLRQMPVTCAVAKLPLPYNFSLPCVLAVSQTFRYFRHGGVRKDLCKFYFKTLSRTLFGYSMRRILEQTAKYTLGAEFGISEDLISAISCVLIFICVFIDATE